MARDPGLCMNEYRRFTSLITASSLAMEIKSKLVEGDNQSVNTVSPPRLLLLNETAKIFPLK